MDASSGISSLSDVSSIERVYASLRARGRAREEIVVVVLDLRTQGGRSTLKHFPKASVTPGAPTAVIGMTWAQVKPLTDAWGITSAVRANTQPDEIPVMFVGDMTRVLSIYPPTDAHYALLLSLTGWDDSHDSGPMQQDDLAVDLAGYYRAIDEKDPAVAHATENVGALLADLVRWGYAVATLHGYHATPAARDYIAATISP